MRVGLEPYGLAVAAEHADHFPRDFADARVRRDGLDERRHQIVPCACIRADAREARLYARRVARGTYAFERGDLPPRVVGYQVQNTVTVKVRKLDTLGAVLDQAVTVGANTVNGISFSVEDPAKLYDEARSTSDVAKQHVKMKEVFDLAADAFDAMGICLAPNLFGIASNRLRNVPAKMPAAWSWPNPGPSMPQQYYFSS